MASGELPRKSRVLQTPMRALAMLEVLSQNPHGVTPKTACTKLKITLSSAYHLLNTLVAAGYAAQSPDSRLFQLGPRVASLHSGFLEALRVAPRLLPFAHALNQATGSTAMIAQMENQQVVASAIVDGESAPRSLDHFVGFAGAAHAMAAGRVLLAWASADQLDAYLARNELRRFTPATLTEPDALRSDLREIREAGYALDREGFIPGFCCVSAPVFSADGSVRESLSTTTSAAHFAANESTLVATTLDIARAASYAMGANPARFVGESRAAQPAS